MPILAGTPPALVAAALLPAAAFDGARVAFTVGGGRSATTPGQTWTYER